MQLVDTNVLFAALVANTPWSATARDLFALDPDWQTERHALVELTNILLRYARIGELSTKTALDVLVEAEDRFAPRLITVPNEDAFAQAMHFRVSAYDARFLAAAVLLGVPVITEDVKLRRAAPSHTQSIANALSNR